MKLICESLNAIFNLGDDVDNFKLKAEFDKVFIDFFKYSKLSVLKPFKNEDAKARKNFNKKYKLIILII